MATDIYEKLAEHLDNLPAGFPRTESGVEMRILRRIFTPEDAEFAMHLTLIPEERRVIARRAKIPDAYMARVKYCLIPHIWLLRQYRFRTPTVLSYS